MIKIQNRKTYKQNKKLCPALRTTKKKEDWFTKKEKRWAKYQINLGTIQGVGNAQ